MNVTSYKFLLAYRQWYITHPSHLSLCELGGGVHLDAAISLGSGGKISLTPRAAKKSTQSHPKFLIFLPQKLRALMESIFGFTSPSISKMNAQLR